MSPLLESIELIVNFNVELKCLSNMIYEEQTNFADAFTDTCCPVLPSHDEVMAMQVDNMDDLQPSQVDKLKKNNTFDTAKKAHDNIVSLKARKTIFENYRAYHKEFVLSK